jgi:hypothetical protein
LQAYSYDMKDPILGVAGFNISVHIVTNENIYGLRPEATVMNEEENAWVVECQELSWAGQQQKAKGYFRLHAERNEQGQIEIQMNAQAEHKIRCVKLIIHDLGKLKVYDLESKSEIDVNSSEEKVQAAGRVYYYPYNALKYNNNLKAPVFYAKDQDTESILAFTTKDNKIREKRFVIYPESTGDTYTIELIHEELATGFDTSMDVPAWVIDPNSIPEAFLEQHLAFAESAQGIGLVPWEKRTDFPAWFRDISLTLTIHGMHWSGFIFNTYEQMAEILRYVTKRIDGKHVLAYLPGWEGRYYWQYGQYRPDPLLGGEEGFRILCDEANRLGVHLMPMFGANCTNEWFQNFAEYGPNSFMKTPSRRRYHIAEPDWDLSRAHDNGWQAFMNTGAPSWRKELVRQILNLVKTYKFDSVFLDLVHHWVNDPDHAVFEGMRLLKEDLSKDHPELLVVGENWYEGLLSIFPLFQVRPYLKNPSWVGRYARTAAHLLEAEPSRGSTGVHEKGNAPYERRPLSKEYLPTVAFVNGTLDHAKDEINAVIDQAQEYKKIFLEPATTLVK